MWVSIALYPVPVEISFRLLVLAMAVVVCKHLPLRTVLVMATGRHMIVHVKTNILAVVVVPAILTTMAPTIFASVTTTLMEIVASVAKNTDGVVNVNCTATRTVRPRRGQARRGQSTAMAMVPVNYKPTTM